MEDDMINNSYQNDIAAQVRLPNVTVYGRDRRPTTRRPYFVSSRTGQANYGDLEKMYTAATAGMLPNIFTAARNFAQGDFQKGFVNLGWTNDVQRGPDGTTYAVVAPGILNGTGNAEQMAANTAREVANARKFFIELQDRARGFVKGGEQGMPMNAMVPVNETGLSVRSVNPIAFDNPVTNPAERQAALDFLRENPQMKDLVDTRIQPGVVEDWTYPYDAMVRHGLRKPVVTANRYTRKAAEEAVQETPRRWFTSPGPSANLGFSENWNYLPDPITAERVQRARAAQAPVAQEVSQTPVIEPTITPQPVQRPVIKLKEGVKGDYRKTYQQNLADDKAAGVGRRARRDFQQQVALSSSDGRAANAGRPNEKAIRDMAEHIDRYPASVQRGFEKVLLKIAKSAAKQGFRPTREEMLKDSRAKSYLKEQLEKIKRGLLNQ